MYCAKHNRIFLSIFLVLSAFIKIEAQVSNSNNLTPREIAKRSLPSVVLLIMRNSRDETGKTGSGFFVAPDIIATNLHVIKNSDEGVVKIVGQDTLYEILGIVGVDEKNDLALLKVARTKGKAMTLNTDDSTAIGDEVFAVGNPQGLEGTFSQGIVSSIRKSSKRDLIQITAPISEGSSGGAVLNDRGEVVGVAVGAIESGQSLNFAIPVAALRNLILRQQPVATLRVSSSNKDNIPSVSGRTTVPPPLKQPVQVGKSRLQFKSPDLIEENLFGHISAINEILYAPKKKFDEWALGEPVATSVKRYNSDGYQEYSEEIIHADEGLGDRSFDVIALAYLGDKELGYPLTFRVLSSYDYSRGSVTDEEYLKRATNPSYELNSTMIRKYEKDVASKYLSDGQLAVKIITEIGNDGKKTITTYGADGKTSAREVIYTTNLGEVTESWWSSSADKPLTLSSTKIATVKGREIQITTTFACSGKNKKVSDCGTGLIKDKNTNLVLRMTIRGENIDNLKYEYEYDSSGNWTKKTEYHQVSKFGKSYFEPSKITIREISYY